jgi:long-subunit fatty acid transport protein
MFLIKRKKQVEKNLIKFISKFSGFVLFAFLSSPSAFATDQGDYVIHAVQSWNNNLEVFQTRTVFSYAFVNEFSVGGAFEVNHFYKSPSLNMSWHLEPFELSAEAGPLFWSYQGERRTAFQFSIYANYLWQITTHFQLLFSAGINLPDKFFRGVPLGLGFRYWL